MNIWINTPPPPPYERSSYGSGDMHKDSDDEDYIEFDH